MNGFLFDAMCVGAHPDDVEIGMGATVAGIVRRGGRVVIVDLTDGEPTPYGSRETRATESAKAAAVLGAERRTLGQPNRYLPGSESVGVVAPPQRQALNRRITQQINEATGWTLTDAFCGFKAYRVAALDCIRLSEGGYAMPLELWAKAWKCGLRVSELCVERIYCDHDRSFGTALDDPDVRYAYYQDVWNRALAEE